MALGQDRLRRLDRRQQGRQEGARARVHARVPQPARRDRVLRRAAGRGHQARSLASSSTSSTASSARRRSSSRSRPAAIDWFVENGYDKAMGARPMARLVQSTLKAPLANEILFGKLVDGGIALVDVKDGKIEIKCEPARRKTRKSPPPARKEPAPVN